jgi:hypothetical protein
VGERGKAAGAVAVAVNVLSLLTSRRYVIEVVVLRLQWTVKRRYTEFYVLHHRLLQQHPGLISNMYFPQKTLFQMSPRVIEERRVALQRYILELASISVPNPVGVGHGLIRIRELDDFLEVPHHVCGPGAIVSPPTLSNSALLGAAAFHSDDGGGGITTVVQGASGDGSDDNIISGDKGGDGGSDSKVSGGSGGGGGIVVGRHNSRAPLPKGVPRGDPDDGSERKSEVQLQERSVRVRDAELNEWSLASETAFPSTVPARARELFDLIVALTDTAARRTQEAKTVAMFLTQCSCACTPPVACASCLRSRPLAMLWCRFDFGARDVVAAAAADGGAGSAAQSPEAQLEMVREFIEELCEWLFQTR